MLQSRVHWLAYTCLAFTVIGLSACAEETATQSADEAFPDVGLGCRVERIGPDNWRVTCPSEDVAVPAEDAGVQVVDMSSDAIDEGTIIADVSVDLGAEPDVAAARLPCTPELTLSASQGAVSPFNLVRFEAAGGSGEWRFEFVENNSGATLNNITGTYLAGATVGVTDEVILTDLNCEGSVQLSIEIVEPMEAAPLQPELEPGDVIEFTALKGSGEFELLVSANRSGGEIIGALSYRAGELVGNDILVIRDTRTLSQQTITVSVKREVRLTVTPSVTYVPLGTRGTISVTGGSGVFDYDAPAGLGLDSHRFEANEPGTYRVDIADRYGERRTDFTVVVMPSFDADTVPVNDHTLSERVFELGDMNGDGIVDLVVARAESDGQAHNGGELAIFLSDEDGFNPEPDQTFYGVNREDELGRAIAAVDVNDDGIVDLIYGIRFADNNGRNSGSLLIHLGRPEGGFHDAPSMVLNGPNQDLEFGFSVATCDFNGDGYLDIAVGARAYEDRTVPNVQWDHGAVLIHLGHQDGFLHSYDQIIPGRLPNGDGVWSEVRSMHLGQAVAAGDFDDDGLCDLAASSAQAPGHVFLYKGRRPDGLDPGGVESQPALWLTSDTSIHENPVFGERLAMGDVDGDGKSDLLIGHHGSDHNDLRNSGAGHLYLGRSLEQRDGPQTLNSSNAEWTFTGAAHDHAGMDVRIVDVDGIPPLDILLTSVYSDRPGLWDVGSIHTFYGRMDGLPSDVPNVSIHGLEAAFRLGVSAAPMGDMNGDGHPDFAAVSHYGGTEYMNIGRPFILVSTLVPPEEVEEGDEVAPTVDYRFDGLELNWRPGGSFFGSGVALLGDIDGDGREEAIVTASHATHPEIGIRSGEMWLYEMSPDGDILNRMRVPPFVGHSPWDIMGSAKYIGDFDGDGHGDFAVQLNNDERPPQFDESYFVPDACVARLNDQGGIFIFRGGPDHFDLVPDYVYWGQASGIVPDSFIGAGDFNGDGRADLAVGAWARSPNGVGRAGSVTLITGRTDPAPDRLTVICAPEFEYYGSMIRHHIGFALTYLSDLDGDGCDELAVGGRGYWTGDLHWRGSVHILHGFGGPRCAPRLEVTKLSPPAPWGQFGTALASGDLNDDGLPELAVGAPYAFVDNQTAGGVYVLDGRYLSGLDKHEPSQAPYEWVGPGDATRFLPGQGEGSETGRGVFIKNRHVGVVTTSDIVDDVASVSTLRLYGVDAQGVVDLEPRALIVGEPRRPGSLLGQREAIGVHPTADAVILGATRGSGAGVDNGSAYWVDLSVLTE
ncbi:MAG: FG-GAP-like repeat-containing protein [Bradymonadia bacterium]